MKVPGIAITVVACVFAAAGCGTHASGPPSLPLRWVDFKTYESSILLEADGQGEVANLRIATATGSDCASGETREYSGAVEWHMVTDYEARVLIDEVEVNMLVKGSFGEPDWSTLYLNSCTDDPEQDGWTTFIGGTGP